MADREAQQKLYAYSEMSNKVQQADRSKRPRVAEGTGEVESLRGRTDIGRMGDRVAANSSQSKDRPAELEELMERAQKKKLKRDRNSEGVLSSTVKKHNILMSSGGQSISDLGELNGYQPTHAGSRVSYEALLVSKGDVVSVMCGIHFLFVHLFVPLFVH
jgi:hypothetical protein